MVGVRVEDDSLVSHSDGQAPGGPAVGPSPTEEPSLEPSACDPQITDKNMVFTHKPTSLFRGGFFSFHQILKRTHDPGRVRTTATWRLWDLSQV